MLVSSLLKFNSNLWFGVITLIQGIILFGISLNRKFSIQSILIVMVIFAGLHSLELFILGMPKPIFETMSNDIIGERQGFLTRILNQLTPILYVFIKFAVVGVLSYLYIKKKDFLVKIEDLEKSK